MKKTDWPIRWDLLLRYRLIEIIALWEGRLTTNHICHSFGIGRQQASKDINTYLRELAPDNLQYDRHLKGYVPAPGFRPVVTRGEIDEYRDLLARQQELNGSFEGLEELGLPGSHVVTAPSRVIPPETMRAVVSSVRHRRQLQASYTSLSRPEPLDTILEPHTLVCTGDSWHLRAWCHSNREFRDFVLSRFRNTPEALRQRARHRVEEDEDWNREVTLVIVPDHRLTQPQQEIIASDYGMKNGRLEVRARAALVPYVLSRMGIAFDNEHPDPLVQQLELANPEQVGLGSRRERELMTRASAS